MFSTAKLLTATAIVALSGGVLIASQFQPMPQVPVIPAAADERAKPVEFEGRWGFGGTTGGTAEAIGNGWLAQRGFRWTPFIHEAGDPRLEGELSLVANGDSFLGVEIWNGYFRIEGEDGAWQQRPSIQSVKRSGELDPMTWTAVFDGEDAYEGLITIMGITRNGGGWDVEGVIVDAVLPPAPEVRDFYD